MRTLVKIFQAVHYLNVAGCGGVAGSASEGGEGDGVVLEGRESVLVFNAASSLFIALELLLELHNLLETNRTGGTGMTRRDINIIRWVDQQLITEVTHNKMLSALPDFPSVMLL